MSEVGLKTLISRYGFHFQAVVIVDISCLTAYLTRQQELGDNLQNTEVLGELLGGKILGIGDPYREDDDDAPSEAPAVASSTFHNPDAEDYFDINEVADEDQT